MFSSVFDWRADSFDMREPTNRTYVHYTASKWQIMAFVGNRDNLISKYFFLIWITESPVHFFVLKNMITGLGNLSAAIKWKSTLILVFLAAMPSCYEHQT